MLWMGEEMRENRKGEKMIDLRQGDCLEIMKDIPDKRIR